MSATEPPIMTTEKREGTRTADPRAPQSEGSWRTLVQRFDGVQWVTTHEYPGDWALQWEAVATTERNNANRLRGIMRAAIDTLNTW